MNDLTQHVRVVAILSIVMGAILAFIGACLFMIIAGAGVVSGEREAMWITGAVGTFVGGLLILLGLPSIIGGIGLLKNRSWARILVIIVAAFSLLNFPLGTAFGVYAIYVLTHDSTRPLFA